MDKAEIQQVVDLLVDVREGLCERDGDATLHLHLTELHRVIQWLMDAAFATPNQDLKVLLAGLEFRATTCKASGQIVQSSSLCRQTISLPWDLPHQYATGGCTQGEQHM